jgi:carbamoylphosphate synthase large subunit
MLTDQAQRILAASERRGWVLEPDAKEMMREAGLSVPISGFATTARDALRLAGDIGYPLVAKVVSSTVLHKSDVGGVILGIETELALQEAFSRLSRLDGFTGVLIEEMQRGLELIVGAKIDPQFGPVILLGIGGTGVEIYQDVAIRMAPLTQADVRSMVQSLTGRRLLEGYRGDVAIDMQALARTLITFSAWVVDMQDRIASVDLNPVMCTAAACVVADARIIMRQSPHHGGSCKASFKSEV